jgi:hypothetical protein
MMPSVSWDADLEMLGLADYRQSHAIAWRGMGWKELVQDSPSLD